MFEDKIINALKKEVRLKEIKLERPASGFGDYAFPCFILAKSWKKNPGEIANDLAIKIKVNGVRIEANGPYINFFVDKARLGEFVIKEILKKKEKYGSSDSGKGKTALIEHTSINPNAAPHVGRARNALIGDSIVRLLRFQGYKVDVHYFVNDVGKQIAMLVFGCKENNPGFDKLLDYYININKKLIENPKLEEEIFTLLNKLETGDSKVRARFKRLVDICVKGQARILNELGVKYDHFDYESKYLWNKKSDLVLRRLKKSKYLFKDEEGRYVLDLKRFNLPMKNSVFVLTRGDGTTLYGLRDIAYTIDKIKKAKRNIVVLGEDQKLYFQQLKAALSLLDLKAPEVVHYSFVLLNEGKMSTRKGNVVLLEDFMNEAKKRAEDELRKRKGDVKRAKIIGYGALKYNILKVSPEKNVLFNWEQALSFEGETGPYCQYSYARINSILKKVKGKGIVKYNLLKDENEIELVKKLELFPGIVKEAGEKLKPNLIANYVYDLCQEFNKFYQNCSVKDAEREVRLLRLSLIGAVAIVIKISLGLLGIEVMKEM